jgi:outer membrane protein assembly factor BamB
MASDVIPAPAASALPGPSARSWFAVALVALYWAAYALLDWIELPIFAHFLSRVASSFILLVAFLAWWLRRRQLSMRERWRAVAVAVAGCVVARLLLDASLDGPGLILMGVPILITAWALWWAWAQHREARVRIRGWYALSCLVWGSFTLIRMNGFDGNLNSDLHWRWSRTAEELYLAERAGRAAQALPPSPRPAAPSAPAPPGSDWPGFRGAQRDSAVSGLAIADGWDHDPPRQLWRQRVGAAWSSMAIVDGRLYTQEQRGEDEAIVCLDAQTGQEIWVHSDRVRFWDSQSGLGPRATPTVDAGRVYALGGTGLLNCLDAGSGAVQWSRDLMRDAGAHVPQWGCASSPLVLGNVVIAFAGGPGPGTLLGYDAATGKPAWQAPAGRGGYGSAQLAVLCGVPQALFFSDGGLYSCDPGTGQALWRFEANGPGSPRAVQPLALAGDQVLIASQMDVGAVLLDVAHAGSGWTATPHWRTHALSPFFNNFVVHRGFAYGFDGGILCCADLQTGRRRWKEGRYDYGQIMLLADAGLLLVLGEGGEAVLVPADPDHHAERGRFQALTGKTWNHPAIAHGRLYVRNAEEMACYQLAPPAGH